MGIVPFTALLPPRPLSFLLFYTNVPHVVLRSWADSRSQTPFVQGKALCGSIFYFFFCRPARQRYRRPFAFPDNIAAKLKQRLELSLLLPTFLFFFFYFKKPGNQRNVPRRLVMSPCCVCNAWPLRLSRQPFWIPQLSNLRPLLSAGRKRNTCGVRRFYYIYGAAR